MKRLTVAVVLAMTVLAMMTIAMPAHASRVSVTELDVNPKSWDGHEVTIVGEIIGDYSPRSQDVWVQVNDDPYVVDPLVETDRLAGANVGIGVRMPLTEYSASWGEAGDYDVRGPVVRVTGAFRYNDPDTGGETFIDAHNVELLEAARPIQPPASELPLLVAALAMLAAGAAMWGRARWRLLNPKP